MIHKHLAEELPFLATELILMAAVQKGKDRQHIHERLRLHSHAAGHAIKEEGAPNDLLQRIAHDPEIGLSPAEIAALVKEEHFVGCAVEQTESFLKHEIAPLLTQYGHIPPYQGEVSV